MFYAISLSFILSIDSFNISREDIHKNLSPHILLQLLGSGRSQTTFANVAILTLSANLISISIVSFTFTTLLNFEHRPFLLISLVSVKELIVAWPCDFVYLVSKTVWNLSKRLFSTTALSFLHMSLRILKLCLCEGEARSNHKPIINLCHSEPKAKNLKPLRRY